MATKADILAQINDLLPTNSSGQISALDVRTVFISLLDNTLNLDDDVISEADAEAGTSTIQKIFTAERTAQAIAALAEFTVSGTTQAGSIIVRNSNDDGWEAQDPTPIGNVTPREVNTVDFLSLKAQYGRPTGTGSGPRTGNITVTPDASAEVGSEAYMYHNDSTAPTVTGANEISPISSDYQTGQDNLIWFLYLPDRTECKVL